MTTFISNIRLLRKKITTNNVGKNVRHLIDNVKKSNSLYALESKEKKNNYYEKSIVIYQNESIEELT